MELFSLEPIQAIQITTIFLGIIDLGLTLDSYFQWPDEEFFLAMVILSLLLSCICLIGGKVYINETTKILDMFIFLVGGGVLLISAVVFLVSALRFTTTITGYRVAERVLAASFGICNGLANGYIGIRLLQELQNSIYPISFPKKTLIVDWARIRGSNVGGRLQVAVIVIGAIDLGLTAHSYVRYSDEAFFLATVTVCFIFSLIELLGTILGFFKNNDNESSTFMTLAVLHVIGGCLLVSGGTLMIIWVAGRNPQVCGLNCGFATFDERLIAGIVGVVNGVIYEGVAYCWYLKSQSVKQSSTLEYDWDYEDLLEPLVPSSSSSSSAAESQGRKNPADYPHNGLPSR